MKKTSSLLLVGVVLLLRMAVCLLPPAASFGQERPRDPGRDGEGGIAVSLRELKPQLDSEDAKQLFGATQFLGFILTEDRRGKDCILIFTQEPNWPTLKLDDLATAYRNVKAGEARPACTIDPRQDALKRLAEIAQKITASREPSEAERHFPEWRTVAGSPQDVRVFNVDPETSFAKTMVDADYLLKRICDGTEPVKGITSFSDLLIRKAKEEIAKRGPMKIPVEFANRFWFNPGKVGYQTDEKLFLLTTCQVTLLTEQEAVNQEGKRSAAGKGNPLAKEFADQFTAQFADAAKVKPVYRELENLYRAVAIVCLMLAEAKKVGATGVLDDTFGKIEVTKEEAESTLPGRGTVKKVEGKVPGGTFVLWLPSCGGVSIDIQANNAKKETDSDQQLPKITQTVLAKRPEPRSVTWTFKLQLGTEKRRS